MQAVCASFIFNSIYSDTASLVSAKTLVAYIVLKAAVVLYLSMQRVAACSSRSKVYPVSIREHGQAAVYFYCLVLSGPLPETTADSMRPYMLSHTCKKKKRSRLYKRVWCL